VTVEEARTIITRHRAFFNSGKTKELSFRISQLALLRKAISGSEAAILHALRQDLGKPSFEAYTGDIAVVVNAIDHALRHLRSWTRQRRIGTPLAFFPAKSRVSPEPYGVSLIIGAWNFPVQLLLGPLVPAMAAGNCAVLKPPVASPHTTRVIAKMITDHFDPAYLSVMEGGAETVQMLLRERFDHIFFTGGSPTGRLVMEAAARHLTPVTLELGGKNPCIVDHNVDLDVAARRIVWGKFYNAGQSCVACDYLLADRRIKDALIARMVATLQSFYGKNPAASPDYGRIVDTAHFDRLVGLLDKGDIAVGGKHDRSCRYIAPTIVENVSASDPLMAEEIFGPILPVISYEHIDEALSVVNSRPRPLALYLFSRDRSLQARVLARTASGGAAINDVVLQETIAGLPFGGVGDSGMGRYHGKAGFDAFSYERGIVRNRFLVDLLLRYPPYRNHLRFLRKIF
jgi:aldehyde dehydrogenase (NAD+)